MKKIKHLTWSGWTRTTHELPDNEVWRQQCIAGIPQLQPHLSAKQFSTMHISITFTKYCLSFERKPLDPFAGSRNAVFRWYLGKKVRTSKKHFPFPIQQQQNVWLWEIEELILHSLAQCRDCPLCIASTKDVYSSFVHRSFNFFCSFSSFLKKNPLLYVLLIILYILGLEGWVCGRVGARNVL